MSIRESLRRKIPDRLKPHLRIIVRIYLWIYKNLLLLSPVKPFRVAKFGRMKPLKLNIGCGKAKLLGWVNIDIEAGADIVVDVRRGLPFYDNSVDLIYCEHVLEHLTYEEGREVLKEFRRCLRKAGRVRLAMPDLDHIIDKYNTDWKNQDWLSWPQYDFIKTKGQMINVSFRWWGHKYLYNEEDLRNQLIMAGYAKIIRCKHSKSSHAELRNLETREDSKLIMETQKQ